MARTAQALYDACRDVYGGADIRVECGSTQPPRWSAPPPVPTAALEDLKRKYAQMDIRGHKITPNSETPMNIDSYDKCCSSPEQPEQTADRLRKQLKAAEKQAACQRKAAKKAADRERQRKADRDLAIDTFADLAANHGDGDIRLRAAQNLLAATRGAVDASGNTNH